MLTHRQILQAVWGGRYGEEPHYVWIYVGRIRRKIEPDPAQPRYLLTEAGVGLPHTACNEPAPDRTASVMRVTDASTASGAYLVIWCTEIKASRQLRAWPEALGPWLLASS